MYVKKTLSQTPFSVVMLLADAWPNSTAEEDGEVEWYEDAAGELQQGTYAPLPPPSLTERGNSSANIGKLESMTGDFAARPSKNGDALAAVFEDAEDRPDGRLNAERARQLQRVVQDNREGTQAPAENEASGARSDLYHGYNPDTRLAQPRLGPVTNRSKVWFVAGAEDRRGERTTLRTRGDRASRDNSIAVDSNGRRVSAVEGGGVRASFQLGGSGQFRAHELETKGRHAAHAAAAACAAATLSARTSHVVPYHTRARTAAARAAPHADVVVGGNTGLANEQGRRITAMTATAAASRAQAAFAGSDAVQGASPRQVSFELMAMRANRILGEQDSVVARESAMVQPGYEVGQWHPGLPPSLRTDAHDTATPARGAAGVAPAAAAQRTRDGDGDSRAVGRTALATFLAKITPHAPAARDLRQTGIGHQYGPHDDQQRARPAVASAGRDSARTEADLAAFGGRGRGAGPQSVATTFAGALTRMTNGLHTHFLANVKTVLMGNVAPSHAATTRTVRENSLWQARAPLTAGPSSLGIAAGPEVQLKRREARSRLAPATRPSAPIVRPQVYQNAKRR